MDTDLAQRATVSALVAAFQAAERDVRAAFATIVAAEEQVNVAFLLTGSSSRIRVTADRQWNSSFTNPDETIARMQRAAWSCIVERLELKRCCSIQRWKKIEELLERGKLPAITEENVRAFVGEYAAEAPQMIAEAVREVFDWLRPRGSRAPGHGSPMHPDRYQANRVVEIPAKVVLPHVVEAADKWGWSPRVSRSQELTALENVFRALTGQGTSTRGYYSDLELAIRDAGTKGEAETELFRIRYFRNGNGHLWIKNAAALSRFNALAGGKNLRPAAA